MFDKYHLLNFQYKFETFELITQLFLEIIIFFYFFFTISKVHFTGV